MRIFEKIVAIENLMLAWKKLERSFHHGEIWYDELALAAFKFRLYDNLVQLQKEIRTGTYEMEPIFPAPYPKANEKPDKEGGEEKMRIRQSFQIDIRDQVVWMAFCNIVGEVFEKQMQAWSYGNRLYVPIWRDRESKELKVGYYRSSNPRIYKKWSNSWPLMRKHISVSIKKLAKVNLTIEEDETIADNDQISEGYFKLPYLTKDYFNNAEPKTELYWTGLDLSKFYEKVDMRRVAKILKEELKDEDEDNDKKLERLIDALTSFSVELFTFDEVEDKDVLAEMQLEDYRSFHGLPTGLEVAGFIANVYMLDIDRKVKQKLATEEFKNLIHFRYVDDHVFVAREAETLYKWVTWYRSLITGTPYNLEINDKKVEPKELGSAYDQSRGEEESIGIIKKFGVISPHYPAPLLTMAMKKVSQMGKKDMNLMTSTEFDAMYKDLQMLLVSDLPEQEIKHNTRISFATTMLTRMMLSDMVDYNEVYRLRKEWIGYVCGLPNEKYKDFKSAFSSFVFNDAQPISDFESFGKSLIEGNHLKKEDMVDWQGIREINKVITRAGQHHKNMVDEVYNLLVRAIKEVPDKPRVWLRAFEFCAKHCPGNISSLYKLIGAFSKEKKMHPLGCEYIEATLNIHRAEFIIRAAARLHLTDDNIPVTERKELTAFLEAAILIKDSESTHYFMEASLMQVHRAIALCRLLNKDNPRLPMGMDSMSYLDKAGQYDATFWMLLVNESVNGRRVKSKNVIKSLFASHLNKVYVSSPFFTQFLGLFISEPIELDEFEFENPDKAKIQNTDLAYSIASMDGYSSYLGDLCDASKLHKELWSKNKGLLFTQWADMALRLSRENTNAGLMPIWSEFVCVRIMLSILDYLEHDIENLFDPKYIHPANISFKRSQWDKHYDDWSYWLNDENKVEVKLFNIVTNSKAYQLPSATAYQSSTDYNMVYALGLIFLQLLTKEKALPWIMNRPEYGFEWNTVLDGYIQKGRVSSLTSRIITSCLSVRNRENRILRQEVNGDLNDLYWVDKPEIANVTRLREELERDLKILKDNLVSVSNGQQRQLLVIDLM